MTQPTMTICATGLAVAIFIGFSLTSGIVVFAYATTENFTPTICSGSVINFTRVQLGQLNWKARVLTTENGTGFPISLVFPALPGAEYFVLTSEDEVNKWFSRNFANQTLLQCFVAAQPNNRTTVIGITEHAEVALQAAVFCASLFLGMIFVIGFPVLIARRHLRRGYTKIDDELVLNEM